MREGEYENAGMFIYRMCVKEAEAFMEAGLCLCKPTNTCILGA